MSILAKGYKDPSTSNYMKLQEGDNTFRLLSDSIEGYEIWEEYIKEDGTKGRRPLRFRKEEEIPQEKVGIDKFGNTDLRFFWALVVYNFNEDRIQILELTQSTIRHGIMSLIRNKKWGDLREYNVCITKSEEDGRVKYFVTPEPKEKLLKEIVDKYKEMDIKLEKLFDGKDPFEKAKPKDEDISLDDVPENLG